MSEHLSDPTFEDELDADLAAAFADDEAPSDPSAPAPEPEKAEATPGKDRGDGRDAHGKFAPKESDAPAAAETPASEVPPASPASPEAEKPIEDAKAAPPPPTPFRVRQGHTDHEPFPGAVVTPEGVLIPSTQAQQLHTLVGRAYEFAQQRNALREQVIRAKQTEAMAKATESAMQAEIDHLFKIAAIPNEEERAIAAVQYVMDLATMRPVIEERQQLARERAELELRREMQAPDPVESREQITQQVVYTAKEHLTSFLPHFEGLTDEDQQTLMDRVMHDPERYAYRAGQQLTPEEREAGVQPGEIVFDVRALHEDATLLHTARQRILAAERAAEARIKAASSNAKLTASAAPPPPAPSRPPNAPGKPKPSANKPGTDYQDWLDGEFTDSLRSALTD